MVNRDLQRSGIKRSRLESPASWFLLLTCEILVMFPTYDLGGQATLSNILRDCASRYVQTLIWTCPKKTGRKICVEVATSNKNSTMSVDRHKVYLEMSNCQHLWLNLRVWFLQQTWFSGIYLTQTWRWGKPLSNSMLVYCWFQECSYYFLLQFLHLRDHQAFRACHAF